MNSKQFYKHLMSGVSAMIPFVVAGGILIALAFLLDIGNASTAGSSFGWSSPLSAWFGDMGKVALGFMLPIMGGFIAYSIADRPGFVPGFVAGHLAGNGYEGLKIGSSGFLGAILGGFLAGYLIVWLKQLFKGLPRTMAGLKPVFIFPVLSTLAIALIMLGINFVVSPLNTMLSDWLKGMDQAPATSKIIVGLVAGAMMAVDMGGPINKAAYVAGVASLEGGQSSILMASVMVAGMTPPLATALATVIFPKKFDQRLKDAGKTNWVMGMSFITEGAIPFAAANPKVIIPSIIAGSGLAGATSAILSAASRAPHGGILVVPVIGNPFGFIIALILGTIASAFMIGWLLPNQEVKKATK